MGWLDAARCAALDEHLAGHQVDPRLLRERLGDDAWWGPGALAEPEGWFARCADLGFGLATFYD